MSCSDLNSTFERSPRDRKNPYSMVNNQLIRDKGLSPCCRLLLIYLLSLPDNWVIKTSHLAKEFDGHWGRDKIRKLIAEAIHIGYIHREEVKENNLRRIRYLVSDCASFKINSPTDVFSGPRDPVPPKVIPLRSTNVSSKEDTKEILKRERERTRYGKHILLFEEEYNELVATHTKKKLDEELLNMDDYISAHGLPGYQDYAAALRRWIKNDVKKEAVQSQDEIAKQEMIEKRREAAKLYCKNIGFSPGGHQVAMEEFLAITHGSTQLIIRYDKPHSFWTKMGL